MNWLQGICVTAAILALYGVAEYLGVANKVTPGTPSEMIYTAGRSVKQ